MFPSPNLEDERIRKECDSGPYGGRFRRDLQRVREPNSGATTATAARAPDLGP
jgi:hypothetical protein